jgi:hypothetical protein
MNLGSNNVVFRDIITNRGFGIDSDAVYGFRKVSLGVIDGSALCHKFRLLGRLNYGLGITKCQRCDYQKDE